MKIKCQEEVEVPFSTYPSSFYLIKIQVLFKILQYFFSFFDPSIQFKKNN
jgi:hypothetical protein